MTRCACLRYLYTNSCVCIWWSKTKVRDKVGQPLSYSGVLHILTYTIPSLQMRMHFFYGKLGVTGGMNRGQRPASLQHVRNRGCLFFLGVFLVSSIFGLSVSFFFFLVFFFPLSGWQRKFKPTCLSGELTPKLLNLTGVCIFLTLTLFFRETKRWTLCFLVLFCNIQCVFLSYSVTCNVNFTKIIYNAIVCC